MYIPQVLLQLTDQLLLPLLRFRIINQPGYDFVYMQLLTAWKPLGLPVTLDHRDNAAKLGGLPQALNLLGLIDLNLVIVLVDDCDAALLHLLFLALLVVIVTELDPLAEWLRHLHAVDRFYALQIARGEIVSATLNTTSPFLVNDRVHVLHLSAGGQ